jgi:alanine racemase
MGASATGVDLIEEGIRLREAGLRLPILVYAPFDAAGARGLLKHRLTPVVGRFEDLQALAEARPQTVGVHIKFNTGMQRLGFDIQDVSRLKTRLQELPFVQVEGVCTHLTHGEEIDRPGYSQNQLSLFAEMSRGFPGVRHYHKTASLAVLQERASGQGARPGIGIYGLPHDGRQIAPGLKPVLSWSTEVAQVREVKKGDSVGYSALFTTSRRSCIGVLPVGYADGYMRLLSNKGQMLFRGKRVPVVGSVCMDYTFIDMTDAIQDGPARPGESVVIIGRQGDEEIQAVDIAETVGTNSYEVVTAISRRIPREAI